MLRRLFLSLHHAHFRRYYIGQLVSITGVWMQNVAQAWLVYRLTGSGLMLGLTAFAGLVPILALGLYGGVVADRYPRRKILLWTQSLAMLQALSLGLLTLTGHIVPWHIISLAFLLGCLHALEMPSRHALIAELVDKSELPNAIALNSTTFTLARALGPLLAGLLIPFIGEGGVFLFNALTYIWVLSVLVHLPLAQSPGTPSPHAESILSGLRYLGSHPHLRNTLILLAFISPSGAAGTVLMPIFSSKVFLGDAHTLGWLLGAIGFGALLAALRLAYLGGRQNLQGNIGLSATAFAGCLILFSQQSTLGLALPILATAGFTSTTVTASINTLIQMHAHNELRGRVMAVFSVIFVGMTSIGHLLAGILSSQMSVAHTVMSFGLVCGFASIAYYVMLRRKPG